MSNAVVELVHEFTTHAFLCAEDLERRIAAKWRAKVIGETTHRCDDCVTRDQAARVARGEPSPSIEVATGHGPPRLLTGEEATAAGLDIERKGGANGEAEIPRLADDSQSQTSVPERPRVHVGEHTTPQETALGEEEERVGRADGPRLPDLPARVAAPRVPAKTRTRKTGELPGMGGRARD